MGSKIDGPSGPRPRFFIVGLSHSQRVIGHYTWLACKTDISEEGRSHQSNVISRLFVVPGPPTDWFRTTNSIAFKLHSVNETVTNRVALIWFWAPKRFNLWLSENFVSHRECRRASIQRHRSHIWGPKLMVRVVPDHDFFIVGLKSFSVCYWPLYMASMQNWHFWRSEKSSI